MSCRLRSYEGPLPGNYSYVQTEGITRSFPSVPVIESLAQDVLSFRRANNLPRASFQECLVDVDHSNAARLGCSDRYTVPINTPAEAVTHSMAKSHPLITPCAGCGAKLLPA